MEGGAPKLEFPLLCHFKIIAEDSEGIQAALEQALSKIGVKDLLRTGNRSSRRRYITFNVDIRVLSLSHMNQIDRVLRAVPGVRVVL